MATNPFCLQTIPTDISRRHKLFQPICASLYQKRIKFTLAYQAILLFSDPAGDPKNLEEAMQYLQAYLHIPMDTSAPPIPLALPTRETNTVRGPSQKTAPFGLI